MRDRLRRTGAPAIVVALLFTATAADACRCVSRTPGALARAADAIVVADVTAIDDRDPAARRYRLHVTGSWKTPLAGPLVVRSDATTCRAELVRGTRYLVYVRRAGRDFTTDACSGNQPAARAGRTIAALGRQARGR